MPSQKTCGQGLADTSALQAKLGTLVDAAANVLELHMTALDLSDENSRRELTAYRHLAQQHRAIATQLQSTSAQMAGYRDLPMGRHDMAVMLDPKMREAFATFLEAEKDLCALVQQRIDEDQAMLESMGTAAAAG
ncbi:MAG TPA: hypothetical protein VGQ52_21400 [Gemmatimonadaceae bacterium]|jgi:hypothetical protein|nr:hypothetical protein [Gemmatimonadaceae bacterium]